MDDMETSVGITLEKIKQQEQEIEARLKEKREYDTLLMTLNRAIREGQSQIEKYKQEMEELRNSVDELQSQQIVEKTRRDALAELVERFRRELDALRLQSDDGVSSVWVLRSTLLEAVQKVSDSCDIWPLLVKPVHKELIPSFESVTTELPKIDDDRLKRAIERRNRAISERNRLLNEPDVGDEYVRIKNAIQYSLDMMANATI